MRLIKLSFLLATVLGLSSCLKSKNDIAGTRNDESAVVVSIAETEYIDQDDHVLGLGYAPFTQFDFTTPATEAIKFFSVHVAQPKKKVNGSLKLTITAAAGPNGDALPAGALTVPPTVSIPAFDGVSKDFPIMFTLNKAALNTANYYSVLFTITASDQGVVSENAKQIEVFIYPGKYYGRYMVETTVTDPQNYIKITSNTKPVLLDDLGLSFGKLFPTDRTYLSFFDEYFYAFTGSTQGLALLVDNLTTGTTATRYVLLNPTYHLDATGKVDAVYNTLTGANYNVTFNTDASNKYTYTDNATRTLDVSYNVTLTAPIPGGTASRSFKVQEKYTYHPIQVRAFY